MKWAMLLVVLSGLILGYVLYPQDASAPEDETDDRNAAEESSGVDGVIDQVRSLGRQVEVYDGVSVSVSERELDLSGRGLSGSLKAEIRQISGLRVLNISDNDFTGLPAEVGQLRELRVLDLSNNPFTGLPYELGNLQNLETLDLRGTNYATQDLDVIRESLPRSTEIITDQ